MKIEIPAAKKPKSRNKRLGMFTDVREVLDAALAGGGGTYTLASHGAAVNWRQRAYQFRKLYAESIGLHKMSPYDKLTLKAVPDGSSSVEIVFIGENQRGVFTPNNEIVDEPADDDLMETVAELAKKIEGDL